MSEGQRAAVALAHALATGWRPPAVPPTIALGATERLFASVDFGLSEFAERQVAVTHSTFLAFGSPLFLAGSLVASAAANAARTSAARRVAAPQWRGIASGVLHITSQRLGMQTALGWWDIAYPDVRSMVCLTDGVVLFLPQRAPLRLGVAWPDYLYVLLNYLAYGRVVTPNLPHGQVGVGPSPAFGMAGVPSSPPGTSA